MQHMARRGGATRSTGRRRGRTPEAIDRVTDALEMAWGSLPEVPEVMGSRLAGINLKSLSGVVLA